MTNKDCEDMTTKKPIFRDLHADDDDPEVMQIESLCMNCYEQGVTRMMLTKIPFFKELIINSFSCEHCGWENNEVQSAGIIQEKGVKITALMQDTKDLNRQVVRTTSSTILIPDIDFEIPPCKGQLTTVEGIITVAAEELEHQQPTRKTMQPEVAAKIDEFISKLKALLEFSKPFKILIDDPSGNSFLENPFAPKPDKNMVFEHYERTRQQNEALGLFTTEEVEQDHPAPPDAESRTDFKQEVLIFKTNCSNCNSPCQTNMKLVDIPHFKEVVIMAMNCDACGMKNNEVKGGSGIEPKGTKITLKVTDVSDLSRDVLKSDTCGVQIPELEIEATEGTLGGKFTTVEGLLDNIKQQFQSINPFGLGDSAASSSDDKITMRGLCDDKITMRGLCDQLQELISGRRLGWHLILNDPAGNSYLQNVYAPDDDPEMKVEHYERDYEQNEILGLNDMITEDYTEDT